MILGMDCAGTTMMFKSLQQGTAFHVPSGTYQTFLRIRATVFNRDLALCPWLYFREAAMGK